MENKEIANELNKLLKGEEMAVQAYEKFIAGADDEKIREGLQQIQKNHKLNADKIAERIQELGAQAEYSTGLPGFFADMKLGMEMSGKSSDEILKQAYDGEDKGIAAAEKVIKEDLDDTSMSIIHDVLSCDHDHLKAMLSLMSSNTTIQ